MLYRCQELYWIGELRDAFLIDFSEMQSDRGADCLEKGISRALKPPFTPAQEAFATCPANPSAEYLKSTFSMADLNDIHEHLWFAGRRGHMEAIHHHKVLLRAIIPTMRSKLHLVWFQRIIYIMPLPDYLLNASFYSEVICRQPDLYSDVVGFFRSYCDLIQDPIDLIIAKEAHLIPEEVTWKQWCNIRQAILREIEYSVVNKRYEYGELRLHQLDLIYRFTGRRLSFFAVHREYQTYFAGHLATFATAFAFVATILTAMQNVINVKGVSETLITTCYRFSIAVLIGICACFGYIGIMFIVLYSYNFARVWSAKPVRQDES